MHDADLLWALAIESAERLVRTQIADNPRWWTRVTDPSRDAGPSATEPDLVDVVSVAIVAAAAASERTGVIVDSLEGIGEMSATQLMQDWLGETAPTMRVAEAYRPRQESAAALMDRLYDLQRNEKYWRALNVVSNGLFLGSLNRYDEQHWREVTLRMCGSCTEQAPAPEDLELWHARVADCTEVGHNTVDVAFSATAWLNIAPEDTNGSWPSIGDIAGTLGTTRPAKVYLARGSTDPQQWTLTDLTVLPYITSSLAGGLRLQARTAPELLGEVQHWLRSVVIVSHRRDPDDRRAVILAEATKE